MGDEPSEREMKKTVPFTNASKGIKYLEINVNQELNDLHRVMDSETGILGWNPSSLVNLLSDPGKMTQWSEAQSFQLQNGHKTSTSFQGCETKRNASLDQGVEGSVAASPCVKLFWNWALLNLWVRVQCGAGKPDGTGCGPRQKNKQTN